MAHWWVGSGKINVLAHSPGRKRPRRARQTVCAPRRNLRRTRAAVAETPPLKTHSCARMRRLGTPLPIYCYTRGSASTPLLKSHLKNAALVALRGGVLSK